MRKAILTVATGLLFATAVTAEEQQRQNMWDDVELKGYENTEMQAFLDSLQNIGGVGDSYGDTYIPSVTGVGPKRTRFLSGFEYEEFTYKNNPRDVYQTIIFADGGTQLSDRWSVRYVLKQTERLSGENKDYTGTPKLGFEIKPTYGHWVNESFSYSIQAGYKKRTGADYNKWDDTHTPVDRTEWSVKPAVNFNYGKHFLHLDLEAIYKDHDDAMAYETEPLYVYRVNDWLNVGAKVLYVEVKDDWNYQEQAVKPLVQFRLPYDAYLELRYEKGEVEGGEGQYRGGYKYDNYAIYTEIPFNSSMSFLLDAAYRDGKRYGESGWGDRKGLFAKAGIVWSF
ncbi:hypothetical protein [Vibrio methylphosphonaticus]|uniref:hypothetical protein n=1 Tax=Vibrio methylphosphonaticus TaxID=2946866 RepID=UPI00202A834D|nr:hypothetical protein [Vibrio methylphosphonaticus]MCL9774051.1 hypothetical protein [Vibrio methylphosphonaticus]